MSVPSAVLRLLARFVVLVLDLYGFPPLMHHMPASLIGRRTRSTDDDWLAIPFIARPSGQRMHPIDGRNDFAPKYCSEDHESTQSRGRGGRGDEDKDTGENEDDEEGNQHDGRDYMDVDVVEEDTRTRSPERERQRCPRVHEDVVHSFARRSTWRLRPAQKITMAVAQGDIPADAEPLFTVRPGDKDWPSILQMLGLADGVAAADDGSGANEDQGLLAAIATSEFVGAVREFVNAVRRCPAPGCGFPAALP